MNRRLLFASLALAAGCVTVDASSSHTTGFQQRGGSALATMKKFKNSLDAYNSALENLSAGDARAIGQSTAIGIIQRSEGLELDETVVRYVGDVGNTVALVAPQSKKDVRGHARRFFFGVLKADAVPNAYSAPGGYVFVTTGLLRRIDTESELAFVLAHEIAHIDHEDGLSALRLARGAPAAVEEFYNLKSNVVANMFLNQPIFDDAANRMADLIVSHAGFWGRKQELAADATGLDYLQRAGYHDAAALRVLEMLAREDAPAAGDDDSHDKAAVRMAKLKSKVSGKGLEGFDRYQKTILSRLDTPQEP